MEHDKKIPDLQRSISPINALLVDDERGAINTLSNMLSAYAPQVRVVRTAMSVSEAVQAAKAVQPDLVFLDIEMPPLGSGFDFLNQCGTIAFGVIFITAYPQHAIRAINTVQPWAYLVKPYSVSELITAVGIAAEKIGDRRTAGIQAAGQHKLLLQDSRKGTIVLRAEEIAYCEADGSFTDFAVMKKGRLEKITSSRSLGEFEAELPAQLFYRTHHSFIVNMAYIDRIERTGRNGTIYLKELDVQVGISVSKMESFLRRFEEFG